MADNMDELERVKAQAAAELSLTQVKPIQTDYHFFVQDYRDKLRPLAEQEVDQSLQGRRRDGDDDPQQVQKERRYLINSNLNGRLLHAWEELGKEEREVYSTKEEEDRRRFMNDDEVASRHCFTLTARIRSPIKNSDKNNREKENDEQNSSGSHEDDVPSPPSEHHDDGSSSPSKRPGSGGSGASPTKKNRPGEDMAAI